MDDNADAKEKLMPMEPIRRGRKRGQSNPKSTSEVTALPLEDLVDFKNHPFRLYEGQRLEDMVESIRANGVLVPIIVRPAPEDGKYEILSGHNRVNAARIAERDTVPAVVYEGLDENEALLIVTETNLIQRSFADMRHSERAAAISVHYDAIKQQGRRSDLVAEVEALTSSPVGKKLMAGDKTGDQFGVKKTTIARYLRINKLIQPLKDRLDNESIGMRVAESLSYLTPEAQELVEAFLADGKKISIKQAEELKNQSQAGPLTTEAIAEILAPVPADTPTKIRLPKLRAERFSSFFKPEQSEEEIEEIICKALEQYYGKQGN